MHKREKDYLEQVSDNGKTYIYQPFAFRLSNDTYYMPDFYCVEDNKYIELVGSRQAYHQNKHKYALMKQDHPDIILEMVYHSDTMKRRKCQTEHTTHVGIRITEDRWKKLRNEADRQNISISMLIAMIIDEARSAQGIVINN